MNTESPLSNTYILEGILYWLCMFCNILQSIFTIEMKTFLILPIVSGQSTK